MLPDLIQKLAHDLASDYVDQSLRFSAAEQMGRSLAREHPEQALELLKMAEDLNKEALGIVGKGLVGLGVVGTGVGAYKGAKYMKKRHQQFQHQPYRHGSAGPAAFRKSWQM